MNPEHQLDALNYYILHDGEWIDLKLGGNEMKRDVNFIFKKNSLSSDDYFLSIDLCFCGLVVPFALREERISVPLSDSLEEVLSISTTLESYLAIPEIKAIYDEHFNKKGDLFNFTNTNDKVYYVDPHGYIQYLYITTNLRIEALKLNYNLFPTKELAEMAKDLSKDSRKALLWQYANNCVFIPNWNCRENKYYVYFNFNSNEYQYLWSKHTKHQITYFKTSEDAQNYIKFLESEDK